jgi:hypothetical protein
MMQMYTAAWLQAVRRADLLASVRTPPVVAAATGVVSGPGNNGSANQAPYGQSGTPGTARGIPRAIRSGIPQ